MILPQKLLEVKQNFVLKLVRTYFSVFTYLFINMLRSNIIMIIHLD